MPKTKRTKKTNFQKGGQLAPQYVIKPVFGKPILAVKKPMLSGMGKRKGKF